MKKSKILINLIILFFTLINSSISIENEIIFKINNEIITKIDVENEYRYLIALNKNLKNLNKNEILEISKKSIVKEKIKIIELSKNFKNPIIPEKYIELILQNIYNQIDIDNLNDFKGYLINKNVNYQDVIKKIEIEALWNELIVEKFSSRIKINKQEIRNRIIDNKDKTTKSYLMSEIIFEISNSSELTRKYEEIKKTIKEKGFDNAALTHSTSGTSNLGGKLGWINENSLNKKLREILSSIKENEFTDPITIPGGFMILNINKIKEIETFKNIDDEVEKIINLKKNSQLNQFSKMYFNKIKNNMQINEI
ncbi:peptidylprolyl isomerase [Candidatus Pelagibacter bacterium nBUS_27]|uniref:peptidylprolyl isomerase n=1 Tax=Candidatus Pelagibacter bacterium nBUS_27 TaxID=3374188 RepID=UPI003EB9DD65